MPAYLKLPGLLKASGLSTVSVRGIAWLGFYAALLAAWIGVFWMQAASGLAGLTGLSAEFWAELCRGADAADLGSLVAMWAIMAAAMMLPTFLPAFRTFIDLPGKAQPGPGAAAALVAGYLVIWGGAAIAGALAQRWLAETMWVAPTGASLSPAFSAALLFGAGAYQFSAFKAACLAKCRMPLTFFMERWTPGALAAAHMGLRLGALCLGCCWALMLLAFVGGTMNLLWMGAATVFMTLEKLPDVGRHLTRPAGAILIAAGAWIIIAPAFGL